MANILYRITANPTVPTTTAVKSLPLSNLEIDGNFKSIDVDLATKASTTDLATKAPINNPTFTGNVGGVTKNMVGLSAVDNTSDINKPISTATQIALNTKYQSGSFITGIGSVGPISSGGGSQSSVQVMSDGATTSAAYMVFHRPGLFATYFGVDTDNKFKVGGFSMGPVSYALYHEGNKPTKADVGLGNVDNTSDVSKSIGGTSSNVTGIVSIANGGTGAINPASARIALGVQSSTKVNTIIISENTTAVSGNYYVATASLILTLPASPVIGDYVGFSNASVVLDCVINNNGRPILSLNESMVIDRLYLSFVLQYTDTTRGWVFL